MGTCLRRHIIPGISSRPDQFRRVRATYMADMNPTSNRLCHLYHRSRRNRLCRSRSGIQKSLPVHSPGFFHALLLPLDNRKILRKVKSRFSSETGDLLHCLVNLAVGQRTIIRRNRPNKRFKPNTAFPPQFLRKSSKFSGTRPPQKQTSTYALELTLLFFTSNRWAVVSAGSF